MNRDLFLAILAMDSYNRGYGRGLDMFAEAGQLGNATLRPGTLPQQAGWEVAGFYAIAYEWNGEKIISYRGTAESEGSGSDVWNGWRLGAGFPQASQGRLAQDFYKAVTG